MAGHRITLALRLIPLSNCEYTYTRTQIHLSSGIPVPSSHYLLSWSLMRALFSVLCLFSLLRPFSSPIRLLSSNWSCAMGKPCCTTLPVWWRSVFKDIGRCLWVLVYKQCQGGATWYIKIKVASFKSTRLLCIPCTTLEFPFSLPGSVLKGKVHPFWMLYCFYTPLDLKG